MRLERRKLRRLRKSFPVYYKSKEHTASAHTNSIDISTEGLRITLPEDQTGGKEAELWVFFPSGSRVSALGKVVWAQSNMTGNDRMLETGFRFTKMDTRDILRIASYLTDSVEADGFDGCLY